MPMEKREKLKIATDQLETAIRLHDEKNFVSAITLAGAAEEILGRLLKAKGGTTALETRQQTTGVAYKILWGDDTTPKRVAHVANYTRNEVKHHDATGVSFLEFDPKAEADDMIERAIDNHFRLTQDQTPSMKRFMDTLHAV